MDSVIGNIRIGTASWTDKTLIQCARFYPPAVKTAEDRLRFYADEFRLVEVDSSYYALPAPQTAQLWAERTPPDFTFDIKAFRLFTQHQTSPQVLPKEVREAVRIDKKMVYYADLPEELRTELWRQFRAALEPLRNCGKLGVVLFQFPPWFLANCASRAHIEECVARMDGYTLAIEFRNETWFYEATRARTLDFERALGVAHVVVDEPRGSASSIPSVWEATRSDIAVVRLHGRNRTTWDQRGLASASDRFNYLYPIDELEALSAPIKTLAARVDQLHVVLNTNYEDQGQVNARAIAQLLRRAVPSLAR